MQLSYSQDGNIVRHIRKLLVLVFVSLAGVPAASGQSPAGSPPPVRGVDELVGLWKAKKRFGPDNRGTLVVQKTTDGYTADMMGRIVPMRTENGELTFALPGHQGEFRAKMEAAGK